MIRKPKVTIGICVKNCEDSIRKVTESIIKQDFPHELIEVIFFDDGSEDRTLSIISDAISRMDMEVKVFHDHWRGIGYARNTVVEKARGDYIIWVDGDMILPKDHVRKQVEFMEKNPKVGIAKAKYGVLPNINTVAVLENIQFVVGNPKYEPGTGGSIYRVEAIRQNGGFDNNFGIAGEDQDVAYRIKSSGWLLRRSQAVFYEMPRRTWKALWTKYFLWGYGLHDALHKNPRLLSFHKMLPPAGFLAGLIRSFAAYKIIHRKRVFLLPLHCVFEISAWWFGYIRSHQDSRALRKLRPIRIKSATFTPHFNEKVSVEELPGKRRVAEWTQRKLRLDDPWYQLILKMVRPVIHSFEGRRVLEVGCGLGGFCIYVARGKGISVGVDISQSAIDKAKILAKEHGVKNRVDLIIADAQFLPIKDESIEIVACSETLEHIENYEQAFHELARAVEKTGYLCITVPNIFSMLFLEYLYFILIGQPKYVKKFLHVEKEEVFHFFKLKRLLNKEQLKVVDIRSTDFLHLHPKIKQAFPCTSVFSEMLETNNRRLKFFGAHIGVVAEKK